MLLENKNAIVYGGGGAIGGAIARRFAGEGANVFLAGRTRAKLDAVADAIRTAGGVAETAQLDALDARAVNEHADRVVAKAGGIDISVNVLGVDHVQGVPLVELSPEDYSLPISVYTTTQFLTATAAARHMITKSTGVILTISTPGSIAPSGVAGGFGVACAAVEGLSRQLAGELGPHGIRVICLRPHGVPEAARLGSHSAQVFGRRADLAGVSLEGFLEGFPEGTLLKRSPTLDQVADVATFMASDQAGAMTGTVAAVDCGAVIT